MKPQTRTDMKWIAFIMMVSLALSGSSIFAQQSNYSFAVEKSGKGRAMILIPGLFCSGKVWDGTVAQFRDHYTCYEITLPGFAGQPAIQSDSLLATIVDQLSRFIVENKLQKPIIVGHSLGGFIAMELGIRHPDLLGGLIIVSAVPFLPALTMPGNVSLDSATKIGIRIKNSMKNQTPAQIGQYQKFMLHEMIRDSSNIALVIDMAVKSDPQTQGEAVFELFSHDLRPEMAAITCPVLVLCDWSAYQKYGATHESVLKNYGDQFHFAKNVTIAVNDSSKHFIMYDEPQWFYQQVGSFQDRL